MIITNIQKDTDKGKDYSVFIDDEFSFKAREQELFKLGIYKGREIKSQELIELKNQVLISLAKTKALNFIFYKPRTIYEVSKKLEQDFTHGIIEEVVAYLTENGYLDDKLYTEKYITEKKRLGNLSAKAIKYELAGRGIPVFIVNEALDLLEYDEKIYAIKLIEKRYKSTNNIETTKIREYLYRKGFLSGTIEEVILKSGENN